MDIEVLRRAPLFATLDDEAFRLLTDELTEVDLSRGASVFREGDQGDQLYFIVSGKVKLGRTSPDGRESLLTPLVALEIEKIAKRTFALPDLLQVVTGAGATGAALVGFVVPKTVGTAVMRNQVKRRLRGLMRDRVGELPDGSRLRLESIYNANEQAKTLAAGTEVTVSGVVTAGTAQLFNAFYVQDATSGMMVTLRRQSRTIPARATGTIR